MELEIDHLFIMVAEGAPEADLLVQFGLTEGKSNTHPNQDTANRRFFFHNFGLELLWVSAPDEATSALTKPTFLYERWLHRKDNISPFGLCLRAVGEAANALPFSSWEYRPSYLPGDKPILIANNTGNLKEPMIFKTPFGARPDSLQIKYALDHNSGFKEVTSLCFNSPASGPKSDAFSWLHGLDNITTKCASDYTIEIEFDHGQLERSKSFLPELPLIIKW